MQFYNQTALTKIRAIYGKMFKEKEYLEIMNLNDIKEIKNYILNKEYFKAKEKSFSSEFKIREELEKFIEEKEMESFKKIYGYVKKNAVLNMFLNYLEILEILNIFLFFQTSNKQQYKTKIPEYFLLKFKFNSLDLNQLSSFEEYLNIFKNTKHYKLLKNLEFYKENQIDFSKLEFALYENLFKSLFKKIKDKTKKTELFELNKLLKSKIECLNLSYIYREKILSEKNSNLIKQQIFPFNKKLNKNMQDKILNCQTKEQMEEIYKKFFPTEKNFSLEEIENYSLKIQFKFCKTYINLSPNITTVFYCFFVLQKIQTLNLKRIVEATHYKLSKERIKDLLIV